MQNYSVSPSEMIRSFWKNRHLIITLIKREVLGRYRGSAIGILWSFLNPIIMLIVYTFAFSVVFKAKWNGGSGSQSEFALLLFAGLLIFNFFAECISKSPVLILHNNNYVKKIIFPLEVLPWILIGSALFHFMISLCVWLIFYLFLFGLPHATILYFPIILLPLILLTVGLSWILCALGVFLRDISQVIGITISVLMFVSPIFYPISALPIKYQFFLNLNPLSPLIELSRDVLFWGAFPNPEKLCLLLIISILISWIGFIFFQKTRKGFADVI